MDSLREHGFGTRWVFEFHRFFKSRILCTHRQISSSCERHPGERHPRLVHVSTSQFFVTPAEIGAFKVAPSGEKKPRRYRPGTKALMEIKRLQKSALSGPRCSLRSWFEYALFIPREVLFFCLRKLCDSELCVCIISSRVCSIDQ